MSPKSLASGTLRRVVRPTVPRPATPQLARPAFVALVAMLAGAGPLGAAGDGGAAPHAHMGGAMSEAAMRAEAAAYWALHAPTGGRTGASKALAAATFTVSNFTFDDGSPTAIDTARISVGESVTWNWVEGFHTITSGTGSTDPNSGALFNQPSDSGHLSFTHTFATAGTYPFYCSFHEGLGMKGVVVVTDLTGVPPPPGAAASGFTRGPAPNPSRRGVRFDYALGYPGHVLAEVFDAGGRRVAVLVDADLPAGAFTATWDGRGPSGESRTGVYYVRLRLPGYDRSRTVVLRR